MYLYYVINSNNMLLYNSIILCLYGTLLPQVVTSCQNSTRLHLTLGKTNRIFPALSLILSVHANSALSLYMTQLSASPQDLVAELCTDYFQRYRRQTHVTPKSYLSFLAGYKTIYTNKRQEIGILAKRMETGEF